MNYHVPFKAQIARADSVSELLRMARFSEEPIVLCEELNKRDLGKLALLLGSGLRSTLAFGDVREIKNRPDSSQSIAESLEAHPLHTDGTFMAEPPTQFMLYFKKADPDGGGVSLFMPLFEVLADMPPEYVAALAQGTVRFSRRDQRGFVDEWQGAILTHDRFGRWVFRWRYDDQVYPAVVEDFDLPVAEAIEHVRSAISSSKPISYQASEGDLILIPNRTYLHGRTALSPNSDRLVYRAWVS